MTPPTEKNPHPQLEYVTITIVRGEVKKIPERADTESAIDVSNKDGIAGALNKLAEYGFRLLDGSTLTPVQAHGANEGILFMYRKG